MNELRLTPDVEHLIRSNQAARAAIVRPPGNDGHGKAEAAPKTKRPHDRARRYRQISITFPAEDWAVVLQDIAEKQDIRLSDLVVYLIAVSMAEAEAGRIVLPTGQGRKEYHRACAWFSLPWAPGGYRPAPA